jgi:hypothetical protein
MAVRVVGGQRLLSGRRCSIRVDSSLLMRLLFFIGVTDDDHLTVIGRPEDVVVEVTE